MTNFDKIAKKYNKPYFQFYYFWVHRKTIKFLENEIEKGQRILDCACGTGNFLNKIKEKLSVYGIDESSKMIEIAEKKVKEGFFKTEKAEENSFLNDYFDLISIIDAFYYFQNKERVIKECRRVLKKEGFLFIFTPSFDNFIERFFFGPFASISSKLFFYNLEKNSAHLSTKEIVNIVEDSGFQLLKKEKAKLNWLLLFQKK